MRKSIFRSGLAGALLLAAASVASADLIIDLNTTFSGGPPAGSAPWLKLTFKNAGANAVDVTFSAVGLTGGEFVSEWDFNLDPSLNPTSLSFTALSGDTGAKNSISTGTNAFQADGDGKYDVQFLFNTSGDKLTAGESASWHITGTGITENSFNFNSVQGGGAGTFTSGAHIQGIAAAQDSGWIGNGGTPAVPLPASLWGGLALLGAVGVAKIRSRRISA